MCLYELSIVINHKYATMYLFRDTRFQCIVIHKDNKYQSIFTKGIIYIYNKHKHYNNSQIDIYLPIVNVIDIHKAQENSLYWSSTSLLAEALTHELWNPLS